MTSRATRQGGVRIQRQGRLVVTLRDREAQEFPAELEGAAPADRQRLMARVTGNYQRGNERTVASHPRNRG
jgi:hypothetical protein